MKEHKRLTNNNLEEYNPEYDFCIGCKYFGEPNGCNRPNGTCANYERFIETYNRLAELEDKIENGTIVMLPCKVGYTVYVINGKDELEEAVVLNYAVNKLGYNFDVSSKNTNEEYYLFDFDFNKDWFLTKAEAEEKIKECEQ